MGGAIDETQSDDSKERNKNAKRENHAIHHGLDLGCEENQSMRFVQAPGHSEDLAKGGFSTIV